MNLEPFGFAVGISDILNWRECPYRMADGMQRHVGNEPPESINWTNQYGSAIHHAIHLVEKDHLSHEKAIADCMKIYGSYLEPADASLLREDLLTFERRRPLGVTLVASEAEMRVPLFVTDEGQQVWFRFKLDVLHRLISNPSVFLHRDYKSTKWPKTPAEVHKDPQLWAYNWGIHERYPECKTLLQTWDGLRFGELQTTKNDQQRAEMKSWLIDEVKAIMADDEMKPKLNDFCRYCRHVITCPEPRRAARSTRARLSVLAPLTKEGRKVKVELFGEGVELEEMIRDELPKMMQTRKHIEHVEKALKEIVQHMSLEERERLGWKVTDRKTRRITADGLRELHEVMGDQFYDLINLPITALEDLVGKPKKKSGEPVPRELEIARNTQVEEVTGTNVVPAKSDKD